MIADLEEEKQRYAQDAARHADFTLMLQTERDKLLQQVRLTAKLAVCMHSLRMHCACMKFFNFKKKMAKSHLLKDDHVLWICFLYPLLCLSQSPSSLF